MFGNGNGHSEGSSWWHVLRRPAKADHHSAPYRRLAMQLNHELTRGTGERSVMLVTTAHTNLCATASALLAGSLAEQVDRGVLLVDACVGQPEASRLVECSVARGFAELLADPALPLAELVLPTNNDRVEFLAAGALKNPSAIAEQNAPAVMNLFAQQYDFSVFCGGSALHDPGTLALVPHVGCVLLLTIENETRLEDLDAARDTLSFCKARRMGLVLTTPVRR